MVDACFQAVRGPSVSSVTAFSWGTGMAGLAGLAGRSRSALEVEAFRLERRLKRGLRNEPLPAAIRAAFAAQGSQLDLHAMVVESSGWKWKLRSGSTVYVIRDRSDHLDVSRERFPAVSRLLASTIDAVASLRSEMRDQAFYAIASFRKRHVDRPKRVLINVGAGKWYQPGWKVVDYTGVWYRYNKRFVDYPLDLMQKSGLPFDDAAVDLFYSEHVFEHFPNDVGAFSFGEMYRALRPGGGIRIVVPDADILYDRFRARDERFFGPWMGKYNATLAEAFIILVGYPVEPLDDAAVVRDFEALDKAAFFDRYTAGLRYDYERAGEHVNWYNFDKMQRMLHDAGFETVTRSEPQRSRFPEIRGAGFDTRPHYSLHVDAVK